MSNFKEPERFWSKVDVGEPDECWEWLACRSKGGYGRFLVHYENCPAHRVAWFLTYGPIPKGLCVLHHCDNRGCCNPYHLFLGTHTDNLADAQRKGRTGRELTPEKVLAIRALYTEGWLQRDLADEFGVSQATISEVIIRKTWKHVP